jgi:predicted O-methyltransferase YrrM
VTHGTGRAVDRQALFALLMQERPKLHGAHDGTTLTASAVWDWSLPSAVLEWLINHIRPGWRTLETGCGYSTVVFALWGCRHQAISPFPEEHQSINEWCRAHGVSVDTVTYRTGPSQRLLPALPSTPLDLVLIDGDHAVPLPLIDFFYTADQVVQHGLLVVDDVQLPSVRQLTDFLDSESPRWSFIEQIERTRIYRKLTYGRVTGLLWREQPFCSTPPAPSPPARRGVLSRALRRIRRTLSR